MRIYLTIVAMTLFAAATAHAEVTFKKIKLDDLFRSEGVAIGAHTNGIVQIIELVDDVTDLFNH